VPSVVEANFYYYQSDKDHKKMTKIEVYLKDYVQYNETDEPVYTLKLNFEALSYFNLINSFQFSLPIYILLFSFVSLILLLGIIIFWLLNIQFCSKVKRPPALRFAHMAKVTFLPPAKGTLAASLPVVAAAFLMKAMQNMEMFSDVYANWAEFGSEITLAQSTAQKRGRLGITFIIIGFIFMIYGGRSIVYKPSKEEEKEIQEERRSRRARERREFSMQMSHSDERPVEEEMDMFGEEKEEDQKISQAIEWKRRHFFISCIIVALFLMVRLEFSYSEIFGENIITFLIIFTVMDIIIEQLLTRVIMGEALLTAPILGSFVLTEFIMTMGADDF